MSPTLLWVFQTTVFETSYYRISCSNIPRSEVDRPQLSTRRAEATARASAQAAVDEAENRARLAREEHEQSSKKLEEQMVSAKVRLPSCAVAC